MELEAMGPRFPKVVEFGQLVEEWRYERRYSVGQAAVLLRVRSNALADWRSGTRRPTPRAAIRFAYYRGLDYLEALRLADHWPDDVPFPPRPDAVGLDERLVEGAHALAARIAKGHSPDEALRCLGALAGLDDATWEVICALADMLATRPSRGRGYAPPQQRRRRGREEEEEEEGQEEEEE
jgi:transcriptional regulator with XRE-family HTH domain